VKKEAPKEYLSLGESLSKSRKHEAENGIIHRIARRLGALFDGVCPATPTSAIQVQLLTCLIAQMYDAPESVSIWVEIVKGRRQEIAAKFDANEQIHYSTLTAAANIESL
jgi:hypothetical protein